MEFKVLMNAFGISYDVEKCDMFLFESIWKFTLHFNDQVTEQLHSTNDKRERVRQVERDSIKN